MRDTANKEIEERSGDAVFNEPCSTAGGGQSLRTFTYETVLMHLVIKKTYTTTRAHHADGPSARPHPSYNCAIGAIDRKHIPRARVACRGTPLRSSGAMRDEARKTRQRRPRRGQPSGGRRSSMAPPSPAGWRRSDRTHGTVD